MLESTTISHPFRVPAAEIHQRIQHLQRIMQHERIDAALILQRVDLFYLSGTAQNAFLYVPADSEPLLMVKKHFPRAREESSIACICEIASVTDMPGLIRDKYHKTPGVLGFELDVLPVREFRFYRKLFAPKGCEDISPWLLEMRQIKSQWEIAQMDGLAPLSERTFHYMTEALQTGISEMEFAGRIETFARRLGHEGILQDRSYRIKGYPWHVLSGKNGGRLGHLDSPASGAGMSPAAPSGAGRKLLAADEPIMVDFGWAQNGYHLDETRMLAIGSMPQDALDAAHAAMAIHDALLDMAGPGRRVGELFDLAVALADDLGYADTFLGPEGQKVSFVGHGIGLELVEPPIIAQGKTDVLAPGMTLALEPKITFENRFCAGIESVFTVTESGSRLITRVPRRIFIRS